MKKYLLTVAMLTVVSYASACTNFIVGKKASADGSVMCTYNADDYGMFIGLCHYPAGKHAKGEMRKIVDWDTQKYLGEIPEASETYNVIGNINEYQVTIGETTYGGREEMVDPSGLIDYGSLIYLALQRSKTAREAINFWNLSWSIDIPLGSSSCHSSDLINLKNSSFKLIIHT